MQKFPFLPLVLVLAACSPQPEVIPARNQTPWDTGHFLAPEKQVAGDPVRGRYILLNEAFMTCGIPYKLWDDELIGGLVKSQLSGALGGSKDAPRFPERVSKNADMPYFLNVFTANDGAEVINGNCLSCHAGMFDGQLMVGLGNATADFTIVGQQGDLPITDDVLDLLGLTGAEKNHMKKMASRAKALGSMGTMRTVGMNPAEMFAVILSGHHDLDTLAWSDDWLISPDVFDHQGRLIPEPIVTSDPPPWWRAHKKNALFYNGMARGDHRGTMALATSVCVDDVEQAKKVDAWFTDMQAYVTSVQAPRYTRAIDADLALAGKAVFTETCAGCHGTYGARETDDTYPNLLIPLDVIGTDPVVAEAGVVHAPKMVEWYNKSFYGQITRMTPSDPFPGYMPPPLDGIWATAPFFHNGSVPTIELVLNSKARPRYWKRVDYDSTNFDEDALGWPFENVKFSQAEAPLLERKFIFDTTYWSQSNTGHTFGDHLSIADRRAVIEYLKTL